MFLKILVVAIPLTIYAALTALLLGGSQKIGFPLPLSAAPISGASVLILFGVLNTFSELDFFKKVPKDPFGQREGL